MFDVGFAVFHELIKGSLKYGMAHSSFRSMLTMFAISDGRKHVRYRIVGVIVMFTGVES